MFEMKITVEAPGLTEAVNNLAAAIGAAKVLDTVQPVEKAQVKPVEIVSQVAQPVETPITPAAVPVQVSGAVPTQTAAVGAPINTPQSVPSAPAPSNVTPPPTIDALSRAGAALCEQGKMPQLIDLLGRYGVQAVTQLSNATPDVLNTFANDLRALGAKI